MHEPTVVLEPAYDLTKHDEQVQGCAISADGGLLLTASDDESVLVWDLHSRMSVRKLVWSTDQVFGVALSRDGTRAVTASKDGYARFWDVSGGVCVSTHAASEDLLAPAVVWANDCWLSEDGATAVVVYCSASLLSQIVVYRWNKRNRVSSKRSMIFRDRVLSLSASDASETLTFASPSTQALHLVDMTSFDERRCVPLADCTRLPGVASASRAPAVAVADAATLRVLHPSDVAADVELAGYSPAERRTPCSINADGSRVVAACIGSTFGVWNVASGLRVTSLSAHPGMATACAMSSDASRVVTGYADGVVRAYDTSKYSFRVVSEKDFMSYFYRSRFGTSSCDLDAAIYAVRDLLSEQGFTEGSLEDAFEALSRSCGGVAQMRITEKQFTGAFQLLRDGATDDLPALKEKWARMFDKYATSSDDSSLLIFASGKLLLMQIFNKLRNTENKFASTDAVEMLKKHAKSETKIYRNEFLQAAAEVAKIAR